jgi:hypothetical protein
MKRKRSQILLWAKVFNKIFQASLIAFFTLLLSFVAQAEPIQPKGESCYRLLAASADLGIISLEKKSIRQLGTASLKREGIPQLRYRGDLNKVFAELDLSQESLSYFDLPRTGFDMNDVTNPDWKPIEMLPADGWWTATFKMSKATISGVFETQKPRGLIVVTRNEASGVEVGRSEFVELSSRSAKNPNFYYVTHSPISPGFIRPRPFVILSNGRHLVAMQWGEKIWDRKIPWSRSVPEDSGIDLQLHGNLIWVGHPKAKKNFVLSARSGEILIQGSFPYYNWAISREGEPTVFPAFSRQFVLGVLRTSYGTVHKLAVWGLDEPNRVSLQDFPKGVKVIASTATNTGLLATLSESGRVDLFWGRHPKDGPALHLLSVKNAFRIVNGEAPSLRLMKRSESDYVLVIKIGRRIKRMYFEATESKPVNSIANF